MNMNFYTEIRAQKDDFFESHPQSPLTTEQKETFFGLNYFSINENLRLNLKIQKFDEQQTIEMQTSTGDLRTFIRYGQIHFSVEGVPVSLTAYSSEHGFFIPFVDSQAGKETYGAGRYLDPELNEDGTLNVDFNLAYNPYCAYNDLYSCPIPPTENRLSVAIKAGEKNYK
jgi:uncharacterized protein (DUF1684 family)